MREQALREYGAIVKNKQYPQAGRLRANMGNIFYEQVGLTTANRYELHNPSFSVRDRLGSRCKVYESRHHFAVRGE